VNQLKTILLFGVLSALFIGIGGAVAPEALGVFVAIAVVMNLGAYFFSDKLVLAMYRAREVSRAEAPDLHAMVEELAGAAGIPTPRVFLVPSPQPNAFATGRTPGRGVVAVTDGILDILDRRELRGVLAHEIAHIKNRDTLVSTVAAILASAVTTVANGLSFGAMFGGHHEDDEAHHGSWLGSLAMLIVAPIAATLIQLAISRSRELHADETGARISGDPDALASALIKLDRGARAIAPAHAEPGTANLFIVNPFGALDSFAGWFSTHPSTEERVARLQQLPRTRSTLRPAGRWS
jgi:heat shock protein HtpX